MASSDKLTDVKFAPLNSDAKRGLTQKTFFSSTTGAAFLRWTPTNLSVLLIPLQVQRLPAMKLVKPAHFHAYPHHFCFCRWSSIFQCLQLLNNYEP